MCGRDVRRSDNRSSRSTSTRNRSQTIFRPVTKAGVVKRIEILDEKVVSRLVVRYARETELASWPLMTCAAPASSCAARPAGIWSRSSYC